MILDSSILIADERGRFALQEFFAVHGSETFCLAAITVSELWHGVERATPPARKATREAQVRQWLSSLPVLAFDSSVAQRHAAIWADLEVRGCVIGSHDLQIAATALCHGHPLATLNQREFQRVPGLQLADTAPFLRLPPPS
jgi:tRNA(fMet)-specific endonuclease VapC